MRGFRRRPIGSRAVQEKSTMISTRLKAAVIAQIAAGAALMTPALAHTDVPSGFCNGKPNGTRVCDENAEEIHWQNDDYTWIVDGWTCQEGALTWDQAWWDDGGEEDRDDIIEEIEGECLDWAGPGGGIEN
jgi:hypothetical protein